MGPQSEIIGSGFSQRTISRVTWKEIFEISKTDRLGDCLDHYENIAIKILSKAGLPTDLRDVIWRQKPGKEWIWSELPLGWTEFPKSDAGPKLGQWQGSEENEHERRRRLLLMSRHGRGLTKAENCERIVWTSVYGALRPQILLHGSPEAYAAQFLRLSRDIRNATRRGYRGIERCLVLELGMLIREWDLKQEWERYALGPKKGVANAREQAHENNKDRRKEAEQLAALISSEDRKLKHRRPELSKSRRAKLLHTILVKNHEIVRSERTIRKYLQRSR